MKSPFPGMDPYIESSGQWRNFHANLLIIIQDALADAVPPRYLVRAEERSYLLLVGEDGKESHAFFPDVRVIDPKSARKKSARGGQRRAGAVAEAEAAPPAGSMKMRGFVEEEVRETFVEIYATEPEHRLVTTLEVLSPTNKERYGHGWNLYLRKRQAALACGVHLVELDMLRGGTRLPMLDPWPNSPYTFLIARAHQHQQRAVWPAYFHEPLPPVPVPLAEPDPDVLLHVQPLIDCIYVRLRYASTVDYTRPLHPPPSPSEADWLRQLAAALPGSSGT